jgi:hypothetical protein
MRAQVTLVLAQNNGTVNNNEAENVTVTVT